MNLESEVTFDAVHQAVQDSAEEVGEPYEYRFGFNEEVIDGRVRFLD